MSWAGRRQALYFGVVLIIILVVLGWVGVRIFYAPPSCFDNKQNGDEEGVDCGGSCEKVCSFLETPPRVLWSRFFEMAPGAYSAVTVIDNPNVGTEARAVSYSLKLYDGAGVLVYERKGQTDIRPGRMQAIFESSIIVGERVPQTSFFEFTQTPEWQKAVGGEPDLRTTKTVLSRPDTTPRLTAVLSNEALEEVRDIEVIAVLFDEEENAVAASRTTVARLEGRGEADLIFTWPSPFNTPVAHIRLFPQTVTR